MLLSVELEEMIYTSAQSITPPLRTVCAWCRTVMQAGPMKPVSHGMCKSCKKKMDDDLDRRMA